MRGRTLLTHTEAKHAEASRAEVRVRRLAIARNAQKKVLYGEG
jgi:hypothetical protein